MCFVFSFLYNFTCLFCWVFIAVWSFPLVVGSKGSRSCGFPLCWLLLVQSVGSRAPGLQQLQHVCPGVVVPGRESAGSAVVLHGLSCSTACGIFPDQGLNPCLLHWQTDSLPLSHQGSPGRIFKRDSLTQLLQGLQGHTVNEQQG